MLYMKVAKKVTLRVLITQNFFSISLILYLNDIMDAQFQTDCDKLYDVLIVKSITPIT